MNTSRNAIVVGVGADGSESALRFAVEEGRRSGHPVHLVHVLQLPAGEAYVGLYGGAVENATSVLAAALDKATQLAGGEVAVTSELVDSGWVVEELAARTAGDRLLVLEHRALGRLHRVFSGSVVQSVAGRARVPVISVPEGWWPRSEGSNVVTAAVQDVVEAPPLLHVAFEEARERKATLRVLHSWWLASGYDVAVVDTAMRAEWTERSLAELEPVLAPLRSAFADVSVTVEVRHAPPVEAILDAAEGSDLVVLGRRHHLLPLGTHLGPVARAALGHSPTPVLITPEAGVTAHDLKRARRTHRLADTLAPLS